MARGRMSRMVYLQHRTALLSITLLAIGIAIAIWLSGLPSHATLATYNANHCGELSLAAVCVRDETALNNGNAILTVLLITLRAFPLFIGVFLGAPLLSREYEEGTFRFTWTQRIGRERWLLSKLALIGTVVVIDSLLLGFLVSWRVAPFNADGFASHWQPGQFDLTPLALCAWSLFSLVLGTCIGAITRRMLPAIAICGGTILSLFVVSYLWAGNWFLSLGARRYRPPMSQVTHVVVGVMNRYAYHSRNVDGPNGSWLVRNWMESRSGHALTTAQTQTVLLRATMSGSVSSSSDKNATIHWLVANHYSYWVSFQPADRFWLFQVLEGVTILSAVAIVTAITIMTIQQRSPRLLLRSKHHNSITSLQLIHSPSKLGPVATGS